MSAPYMSIKRLADNSLPAMLSAVEAHNKPQMTYRHEVTVMLRPAGFSVHNMIAMSSSDG